ncbi:hypothetical protein [Proteiniclasticum sp.]|uniref:hypothetical protein n=1 Tax=Proteiniclasticum sp. TaxID=2053595 RepID=UPI0028A0DC76|nr:hypothetical protein [Proteiniclasticum sp.]
MMERCGKGFINVFFLGGLLIILMCSLVLTEEAGRMRTKRAELENMLAFDYRVEAYYLLIESGALSCEKERAYGSLSVYEIEEHREGDNYITIEKLEDRTLIKGYFKGVERTSYEISR